MMAIEMYDCRSDDLHWEISGFAGRFHVSCLDPKTLFVGSGFAKVLEAAKRKAFVELNERALVHQLSRDERAMKIWRLDDDPSGSGFAAGFDESRTIVRSLLEATERWALSKWIDSGLELKAVAWSGMSSVERFVSAFFEGCSAFKTEVPLLVGDRLVKVNVAVVLGWTQRGVFAGYGSKLELRAAVEQASIEALRNRLIYKNQVRKSGFPFDRIWFFAEHREVAEETLRKSRKGSWPMPRLGFLKTERFGGIWLARAIVDGWEPWQLGSETRFLY